MYIKNSSPTEITETAGGHGRRSCLVFSFSSSPPVRAGVVCVLGEGGALGYSNSTLYPHGTTNRAVSPCDAADIYRLHLSSGKLAVDTLTTAAALL